MGRGLRLYQGTNSSRLGINGETFKNRITGWEVDGGMKRILKKRILSLLCVGLLLCTPHTIAYVTVGGIESTIAQMEEAEPSAEMPPAVETTPSPVTTPPAVETAPSPVTTPPAVETTPSPVTTPPAVETTTPEKPPTTENTEQTSYSVEITWESLEFDYVPLWNPDEHCYDEWESTGNPITVKNTTKNGASIRVTLTFISVDKKGVTAVFTPCEEDPHPEDFTFSNGQVTFLLPRDTDSEAQATVNLFLIGDPMGWKTQQYNQIGSIKTEFTPLHEGEEVLETVPSGISDIQSPPVNDLPLPKPVQENTLDVMPPPKQSSKEEAKTAPNTESGAPPQEEPP